MTYSSTLELVEGVVGSPRRPWFPLLNTSSTSGRDDRVRYQFLGSPRHPDASSTTAYGVTGKDMCYTDRTFGGCLEGLCGSLSP